MALPLDLRWRPTGAWLLLGPRFAARWPVGRPRLSASVDAPFLVGFARQARKDVGEVRKGVDAFAVTVADQG
jgi:hypothetical protein